MNAKSIKNCIFHTKKEAARTGAVCEFNLLAMLYVELNGKYSIWDVISE